MHSSSNLCFFFKFRKWDLIVGGLGPNSLNSTDFKPIGFYTQNKITWCIRRAMQKTNWLGIYYIYRDKESWLIGTLSLILITLMVYFLSAFEKRHYDIWESVIHVCQTMINTSNIKRQRGIFRILLGLFLICSVLISIIFNIFFKNFKTAITFEHQVQSFDGLKSEHFRLFANPFALEHLKSKNAVKIHYDQQKIFHSYE